MAPLMPIFAKPTSTSGSPSAPTAVDPAVLANRQDASSNAASSAGSGSTILTAPQGVNSDQMTAGKKALLGI